MEYNDIIDKREGVKMSENNDSIEIPAWVVSKIGSLELENELLRQENTAFRQYIQSLNNPQQEELVEVSEDD